jgi:hypothetical protein
MASPTSRKTDTTEKKKPRPLHVSRSFSRLEPTSPASSTRSSRANTIQNDSIPERPSFEKETENENPMPLSRSSTSDKSFQEDRKQSGGENMPGQSPTGFDELPIELKSLADR